MKKSLFAAAIAAIALVACNKKDAVETANAVDSTATAIADTTAAKVDSAAAKVDSVAAEVKDAVKK